jgi:hypothetical protein
MALLKIYTEPDNFDQARNNVARSIKLVAAAALNCPDIPTGVNSIETVLVEGIDLIGIDYIIEVISCKRPNMQKIADDIIAGLNEIYPELLFSVYFNLIEPEGMANTLRPKTEDEILTMLQAIEKAKN